MQRAKFIRLNVSNNIYQTQMFLVKCIILRSQMELVNFNRLKYNKLRSSHPEVTSEVKKSYDSNIKTKIYEIQVQRGNVFRSSENCLYLPSTIPQRSN